jgi:hypothetical protein
MKQSEARKVLGLDSAVAALTPEIVTEAFRARCKECHPDTVAQAMDNMKAKQAADTDSPVTVWTMDKLTTARKTLMDALSGADFACKLCGGSGKVRGRMGLVVCGPCKGTGDKR